MSSYSLKCGENTKSIILQVSIAINGGAIILSRCAVCSDKNQDLLKKEEAKRLLSIRTLLKKIPILRDILV